MTSQGDTWFLEACRGPFAFLVERYGFSGPTLSRGGNEFTVRYERKKKTVAITVEPFGRPVVALYYPSSDLAHRQFPAQTFPPLEKGLSEEEELRLDLLRGARELEANARDFIADEKTA